VTNLVQAREAIQESIKRAEQMAGYRLESACVGVTGRHIMGVNNNGMVAITRADQIVRPSDLRRVMDVALNIRSATDRKLLHTIPRAYLLDGQEVKDPVGMTGYELNVEAHVITASMASVQNLTKCVLRSGVSIDDLILEPMASAEAVLSEEEKQDGVLVADIGGGTTDVAVVKDGSIYHSSVLPVAGHQVTHDIAVGLGLSFELAEEMKRKYAAVMPTEGVSSGEVTVNGDGHSVSSRDLCDIVYARVEELIRLIMLELPRHDYAGLIPAGLVLTGGSANLPGIMELAREVTRLPVKVGVPLSVPGVSSGALNDAAYATSVGLLLWRMRNAGMPRWGAHHGGIRNFLSPISRIFH
jgi:cell division protein FtsA